jgi:3-oxoacyl-[acyl-carrier-protein] synthase-3
MTQIRSILAGVGGYLPERVLTNDELARTLETSDAWITERTGIRQRHIAGAKETAAFMGTEAARAALADAGAEPSDVDAIILATSTPDQAFPATALRVQAALGVPGGFGFDLSAACAGFIYALSVADGMIRTGQARGAQGSLGDILYVDGAVGRHDHPGHLVMNGREVFRHAVLRLAEAVDEALAANGLTRADVDWLVPHQANLRIIDAMGRKLGLAPERVVVTVDRHANTSAASVPLALAEAWHDGRIRRGDLVLLEALGGGLTWGSALVRL